MDKLLKQKAIFALLFSVIIGQDLITVQNFAVYFEQAFIPDIVGFTGRALIPVFEPAETPFANHFASNLNSLQIVLICELVMIASTKVNSFLRWFSFNVLANS
jgi:hypothetical protein